MLLCKRRENALRSIRRTPDRVFFLRASFYFFLGSSIDVTLGDSNCCSFPTRRERAWSGINIDVKTWTQVIGSQLTGLKVADTQRAFHMNSFLSENVSGLEMVERIASGLEAFFDQKQKAVQDLAAMKRNYCIKTLRKATTTSALTILLERSLPIRMGIRTDYSDAHFPNSLLQASYSE